MSSNLIRRTNYNEYHRQYNKKLYDTRMNLAKDLLGNKCNFCRKINNLQIDHIIPLDKKYNIHYVTRLSLVTFLDEIKKCQLLCDECHGFKTQVQLGNITEHGTGLSGKKNCKCDLCKAKKREYMKKYMKDRRNK